MDEVEIELDGPVQYREERLYNPSRIFFDLAKTRTTDALKDATLSFESGLIKQVRIGRENGTDTFLNIAAADGDKAYNFAVVNATLAAGAGLRGLVCSPLEIVGLRQMLSEQVQLVTPGIRTGAEKADDQKRTLTPREAMTAGANWLVIGRPICAADNPRAAGERILASLA